MPQDFGAAQPIFDWARKYGLYPKDAPKAPARTNPPVYDDRTDRANESFRRAAAADAAAAAAAAAQKRTPKRTPTRTPARPTTGKRR